MKLLKNLKFCHSIYHTQQKHDPNKKNIKVLLDYNLKKNLLINANETKFNQVIINLLSNAYKFTSFGQVVLKAKYMGRDENGKEVVRIEVEDSGAGLSEDELALLFKPFSQINRNQSLNKYGSGLGLNLVKDLLNQMGSEIKVVSTLNKGSVFYFDIQCINIEDKPENLEEFDKISLVSSFSEDEDETKTLTINEFNVDNKFISTGLSDLKEIKEMIELAEVTERAEMTDIKGEKEICDISSNGSNISKQILRNSIIDKTFMSIDSNNRKKINNNVEPDLLSDFFSIKSDNLKTNKEINKKCINFMICDDNQTIINSIVNLINRIKNQEFQLKCFTSVNAIECLNKIYEDYNKGINYNFLLIDENMPGINGSVLIKILNDMYHSKQLNKINMYSITFLDNEKLKTSMIENGCKGFLPKPVSLDMIKDLVKDFEKEVK